MPGRCLRSWAWIGVVSIDLTLAGCASSPASPGDSSTPEAVAEPSNQPPSARTAADGMTSGATDTDAAPTRDEPAAAADEAIDGDIELVPAAEDSEAPLPGGAMASDAEADEPGESPVSSGPAKLYLAGDSIVQTYAETASDRDQAGWGQMLGLYFDDQVRVENRAIGGRTARRFIDEGRLDDILDELQPGQYLLVQFGTNDGNRTATYTLGADSIPYFLDPATDFKTYLQVYIDAARGLGALPVLVTPTPRNSAYCTGGNGTGAHAQAIRELGEAEGVPVVDLNLQSVNYLRAICPAPTPEDFFLSRADGTVDGTHFQENGARILAGFVAAGLRGSGLPLVAHLKPEL